MSISPRQIKAARALLDWSQDDLSEKCGISSQSIRSIEKEQTQPKQATLETIAHILDKAGVQVLPNDGVSIKGINTYRYYGTDGFRTFFDEVYEVAKNEGGDIVLYNTNPEKWRDLHGEEWMQTHIKRMDECKDNFTFRATVQEDTSLYVGSRYGQYRWIPEKYYYEQSFYVYGDRLALLDFSDKTINIMVIKSKSFSDSFRNIFNVVWETVAKEPADKNRKPSA